MQARVHHVARPLQVAAVLYGECLERYYRQRVFHLALGDGVASRQLRLFVDIRVFQVAVAYEVQVVVVCSVQPALDVCALLHSHAEHHVHAVYGRTCDGDGVAVLQVGECHEVLQLIVCRDRRVAQYVVEVGGWQHVYLAPHVELVQFAAYEHQEVDVHLSVSLRTACLLGVDELEVLGSHPQIYLHVVCVGEVHLTLCHQRFVVGGIELEVVQQQSGVLYPDGVVVHPQSHAVGHGEQGSILHEEFAVHLRLLRRTLYGERTLCRSFETYYLVGDESVDHHQREFLHVHLGVDVVRGGVVGAGQRTHLCLVLVYHAVYVVRAVALWHVGEFRAYVAQFASLVQHILDVQVARYGECLVRILHHVEVAVHYSLRIDGIGQGREQSPDVEFVDRQRQVLQVPVVVVLL